MRSLENWLPNTNTDQPVRHNVCIFSQLSQNKQRFHFTKEEYIFVPVSAICFCGAAGDWFYLCLLSLWHYTGRDTRPSKSFVLSQISRQTLSIIDLPGGTSDIIFAILQTRFTHFLETTLTRTTSSFSGRMGTLFWSAPGMSSTISAWATWRRTSTTGSSGTQGIGTWSCVLSRGSRLMTATITSEFLPKWTLISCLFVGQTRTIQGVETTRWMKPEFMKWHERDRGKVTLRTIRGTILPSYSQVTSHFFTSIVSQRKDLFHSDIDSATLGRVWSKQEKLIELNHAPWYSRRWAL